MNIFHGKQEEKDEIVIKSFSGLELTKNGLGIKNLVQIFAHQPGFNYENPYILRDDITKFRFIYAISVKENDLGTVTTSTLIPKVEKDGYTEMMYHGGLVVIL